MNSTNQKQHPSGYFTYDCLTKHNAYSFVMDKDKYNNFPKVKEYDGKKYVFLKHYHLEQNGDMELTKGQQYRIKVLAMGEYMNSEYIKNVVIRPYNPPNQLKEYRMRPV